MGAPQLLLLVWMLTREFFFSSLLLAFTGTLMVLGSVLLIDGVRRAFLETYKRMRYKPVVPSPVTQAPKEPEENAPDLEHAA